MLSSQVPGALGSPDVTVRPWDYTQLHLCCLRVSTAGVRLRGQKQLGEERVNFLEFVVCPPGMSGCRDSKARSLKVGT